MADEYKPLIVGQDYSRLLRCIEDLRALILRAPLRASRVALQLRMTVPSILRAF